MSSDNSVRRDIGQFLTTRRARITPSEAGLPSFRGKRRVPGLRREEVALLAGISIEYYTRLERGHARGVSDEVIENVAAALQLNDIERAHFVELVRIANAVPGTRRATTPLRIRRTVRDLLEAMTGSAVFVRNARMDVLATSRLGRALYYQLYEEPANRGNLARFVFLDHRGREFYRNWNRIAQEAVGSLRIAAVHDPDDQELSDLIGELSVGSEQFRVRWAAHEVRYYRTGTNSFRHPAAGDFDLDYTALELAADPGLTMIAYTAGSRPKSKNALELLRKWGPGRDPSAAGV
ncbi:helix-turn-helix transcriptional regulator [Amycolatopsis acidicola]|uniref:Helix-turn-helix transcriptional regulator n=1 Tax=Amycolatopsis acidicola TaxID=2596893 RepID=A0A5N0VA96_9PSEU|nr:helix-turn-helix transcriptional regulator [Amycolatopsis acidicola]KAA9163286.1 helix-turn-helix transcriptional regulator [Amycolatopsis acidicola]